MCTMWSHMAVVLAFVVMFAVLPASWCYPGMYPGSCAAPSSSLGCGDFFAHDYVEDNEYCSVRCAEGYHAPTAGSVCHNGQYTVPLECVKDGASCAAPSSSLGCNWDQASSVGDNEYCSLQCAEGYIAPTSGSTCQDGQFSIPLDCVKEGGPCAAPASSLGCNYNQASSVGDNEYCSLQCAEGYTAPTSGSTCHSGQFDIPLECVKAGGPCAAPSSSLGCNWDQASSVGDNEYCSLQCAEGYHAPTSGSVCHSGQFTVPLECVKDGASCAAPSSSLGCNWDEASSVGDNEYCSLQCAPGYYAPTRGSICQDGQFFLPLECVENGSGTPGSPFLSMSTIKELPKTWLVGILAAAVLIILLTAFFTARRYSRASLHVDQYNLLSA